MSKASRNLLDKESIGKIKAALELSKERLSVPQEASISAVHVGRSFEDDRLIGVWITVDGPSVTRKHGPEPIYRYWMWIDEDLRLFLTVSDLYTFVATKLSKLKYRCKYTVYRNVGNDLFEASGSGPEAIDLARYAPMSNNLNLAAIRSMEDAELVQYTARNPYDLARLRLALINWATDWGGLFTSAQKCIQVFMKYMTDVAMRTLDPEDVSNYSDFLKELLQKNVITSTKQLVLLTQMTIPTKTEEPGDYLGTWLTFGTDESLSKLFWIWVRPDWSFTRHDLISEIHTALLKEYPSFIADVFTPDWKQVYRAEVGK